jgi:hypothetical protein
VCDSRGVSNRWSAFWAGPNRWARDNPWQWAVVGAVGWFFAGWALSESLWVALIAGAVGYVVVGLSVSGGPGRWYLNWRLRDRP